MRDKMSNKESDEDILSYEEILYMNRIISINKDFTEETCSEWIGKIVALDLQDDKPIILLINSNGGSAYPTMGLIDVVQNSNSPVYTVCVGIAASCAANLLVAGTKRFATPKSSIMIHQIYTSLEEVKHAEILNEAKEMKRLHEVFIELYLEKTNMTRKKIEALHKGDNYINPDEALDLGIIDEIGWKIHDWIEN